MALREALNPATGPGGELAGLRVGDRVLQTRNDADLDVATLDPAEITPRLLGSYMTGAALEGTA